MESDMATESNRWKSVLFVVLSCALVGYLRIIGVKHIAYQAAAHMLVGGLFGAWWVTGRRFPLFTALAMTVLETLCFLRDHN